MLSMYLFVRTTTTYVEHFTSKWEYTLQGIWYRGSINTWIQTGYPWFLSYKKRIQRWTRDSCRNGIVGILDIFHRFHSFTQGFVLYPIRSLTFLGAICGNAALSTFLYFTSFRQSATYRTLIRDVCRRFGEVT